MHDIDVNSNKADGQDSSCVGHHYPDPWSPLNSSDSICTILGMPGHECKLHSRHIQPTGYRVLRTLELATEIWRLTTAQRLSLSGRLYFEVLSLDQLELLITPSAHVNTTLLSLRSDSNSYYHNYMCSCCPTGYSVVQLSVFSISRMRTCISGFHPPNMSKPDPRTRTYGTVWHAVHNKNQIPILRARPHISPGI